MSDPVAQALAAAAAPQPRPEPRIVELKLPERNGEPRVVIFGFPPDGLTAEETLLVTRLLVEVHFRERRPDPASRIIVPSR